MSLAKKMQQGGTTPNLYSFYGKQYDYNDLAQAADQGLNEYLATLKRGEKNSDDFRTAYSNIMSGIKDGTITFDNGQFHDSKGRYTNSDKKNRDYYGLMANYIYGKMGQSGLYKKPEETPWDASTNVRKALMQELYNSDTPNLQDFLDLDTQKDGVRALTNRSVRLANAFQSLVDNWDSRFTGYSDNDKTKYKQLLGEAATALRDGTIDPGDYLALSRAVGGVDFREMLATGSPVGISDTSTDTSTDTFTTHIPTSNYKLKSASLNTEGYSTQDISYMTNLMSKVKSTQGLVNILRNSFYNKNYRFAKDPRVYAIFKSNKISSKAGVTATLNALYNRGVLKPADPNNPNLMYIPGLRTKRGTAWVWDRATNQIAELQNENIPYLKAKLSQITSHKQGGVLYAGEGVKVPDWRDAFTSFDQNKYTYEWGDQAYGMDKEGNFLNTSFGTTGAGYNQNRYTTDPNYRDFSQTGRETALAIENSNNYKAQTDKILSDYDAYNNATDKSALNEKNNLFLRYSKWYDSQQTNAASKFWNQDKLNTSWSSGGNNYYGSPTNSSNDIKERIRNLRNDQMVSLAHNNFKATGKRYFYIDKNGAKQWVDPEVAKNYKIKEGDPTITQDGFITWNDYELVGTKDTSGNTGNSGKTEGSEINPTQQPQKQPSWWDQHKQEIMDNVLPLGAEASRLALSLRTNNKIADIQKKAINPVLKNTYELYSPVTGAFSEMQFRNRQAADVRRQAAQPYTSDASLNTARSLEANRQATDLEYQGFLADDKEIQRTKQEALKRQEDNIARRTDVANFNRASINQTNREKAEIEAQRLNANHQGVDNFIANNIVAPLKEKAAYNLGQKRQDEYNKKITQANYDMAPITRQQEYQKQQLANYYANEERKIYRKYQNDFTRLQNEHASDENYDIRTSPEYQKYEDELIALQQQQSKDAFEMSNYFDTQTRATYNHIYDNQRSGSYTSSPFTFTPDSTVQQQNWYKILNGVKTNKKGGKLSLTTQYLLNKVIK